MRFTNTRFNTYKIGDLSTVVTGGTPSTKISNYWDGDIPWMPSGDIHKKYIFNVLKELSKEGKCVIVVSHNPVIKEYSDKVLSIKKGILC